MGLDDLPEVHDDASSNLVRMKSRSVRVPGDWDNDDEGEMVSQKIWEAAYAPLLTLSIGYYFTCRAEKVRSR